MNIRLIALLGLLTVAVSFHAAPLHADETRAAEKTKAKKKGRVSTPPPTKPPLDPAVIAELPDGMDQIEIYLLMGQSNMKGRGHMPEEPLKNPQIIMMHKPSDGWFLARHPLHLVGRAEDFKGADNAGVGPGLAFAEAMAKVKPNTRIALIPCAVGGTAIAKWKKGAKLYEEAIRKARLALSQAPEGKVRIAGALWLQGEADANSPEKTVAYPDALNQLVDNLRADLEIPDLPFIAATIGEMRDNSEAQKKINTLLLDLPNQRKRTACVDARDLVGHIGDSVHFDTASQNEIGERFAAALIKLSKESSTR